MMLTAQTLPIDTAKATEDLVARFMLPDQTDHACRVTNLSISGATFLTNKVPHIGVPIVAYIGELGRTEVLAGPATEGGFLVTFSLTGARLERLQQRIKVMLADGVDSTTRRYSRLEPSEKLSHITLPDGRVYPCEVLDISIASAAIKTDVIPGLGTFLMLGRMKGRVVRYLENGVAIEFVKRLEPTEFKHVDEELRS